MFLNVISNLVTLWYLSDTSLLFNHLYITIDLYNYFSENILLSTSQFGFRSGASQEQARVQARCKPGTRYIEILWWYSKIVRWEKSCQIFVHPSKAFDWADHNILLSKLKRNGIHALHCNWSEATFCLMEPDFTKSKHRRASGFNSRTIIVSHQR